MLRALLIVLILGACVGPPTMRRGPVARPSVDAAAIRQCLAKLDRANIRYTALPDRVFAGGCSALGSVQLRDIGMPTTNLGAMTCPLAYAFALWAQSDLQAPATGEFDSPVVRIETFGTYSCRNINGAAGGRLSEHASANAVDVSAFVLKNGRRISVLGGWSGDESEGRFLRSVRASACRRFNTVLSPDYNAAHRDHLHFDMGRGPFCR